MKLTRQKKVIVGILALVLSLMVGYAIFSESLNIGGTASTGSSDFSIIFSKVNGISEKGSGNATANIIKEGKELEISVPHLEYPTSYAEFDVTIKNEGELNAVLTGIETQGLDNPDIKITYSGIEQDEILGSNQEKKMKIRVTWDEASTTTSATANFTITITYEQDTNNRPTTEQEINEMTKDMFNWDGETIVSGLTEKGIEYVKSHNGHLEIPEGVTEIADAMNDLSTTTLSKGFSPITIGKLDMGDEASIEKINNPEINIIKSVSFPSTLKKIGSGSFICCSNLSGNLVFPKSLENIGAVAFALIDGQEDKISNITFNSFANFEDGDNYSFLGRNAFPEVNIEKLNLKASGVAGDNTNYSYNSGVLTFDGPNITSTTIFNEIYNQIIDNNPNLNVLFTDDETQNSMISAYLQSCVAGWTSGDRIPMLLGAVLTNESIRDSILSADSGINLKQGIYLLSVLKKMQVGLSIDFSAVEKIGTRTFSGIVTDVLNIPDSVITIEETAFPTVAIKEFNFGKGISVIPKAMFYAPAGDNDYMILGGSYVDKINIPEGITSIEDQAFRAIRNIESITIPSTINSIGNRAFKWCDNLKTIINKTGKSFNWGNAIDGGSSTFETGTYKNGSVNVTITK